MDKDYISDVQSEENKIDAGVELLGIFIRSSPKFNQLSPQERMLIRLQKKAMEQYLMILQSRLSLMEDASHLTPTNTL